MLNLIGTPGCEKCKKTLNYLSLLDPSITYIDFSDLPTDLRAEVRNFIKNNKVTLPIIIDRDTNQFSLPEDYLS
jgi:glutaredoxin